MLAPSPPRYCCTAADRAPCDLAERVYPSGIPTARRDAGIHISATVRALIVLSAGSKGAGPRGSSFFAPQVDFRFHQTFFCMPDRQRGAQRPPFHAKRRRHRVRVGCGSRSGETSVPRRDANRFLRALRMGPAGSPIPACFLVNVIWAITRNFRESNGEPDTHAANHRQHEGDMNRATRPVVAPVSSAHG